MGDTVMNFADLCCKPFVEILRMISDFPITVSVFVSFLVGLVNQDFMTGFMAFGICLAVLAVVYVLTWGKAFGKGGLKNTYVPRS